MFDFIEPKQLRETRPLVIDSFAGGGGASKGISGALGFDPDIAINHNELALSMHQANHPNTQHLITSVHAIDPRDLLKRNQKVGVLWASPDCTHFSRARGSKPVSKNIRGLAWVVVHWCEVLGDKKPDIIFLENVIEFQTWEDFKPWTRRLKKMGYKLEFKTLKASDYGAPTIRQRLFMVARCDGKEIKWPTPTHGDPKSLAVKTGKLKKWRSAGECIDWSLPIPSIFDTSEEIKRKHGLRAKRPLVDKTLSRIAAGIQRYVIDAQEPYFISYAQHGGASRSINDPMHTICASRKDQNQIITAKMEKVAAFMAQHNTGVIGRKMAAPLSTLTASGSQQNVVAVHMINMRGGYGQGAYSAHDPLRTITAQGGHAFAVAALMKKWTSHKDAFDDLGLCTTQIGNETYVITDIKMRSLTPREQFTAQGFPKGYIIDRGHDGKKFCNTEMISKCGNSVSPPVARALVHANCADMFT